MRVDGNWTWLRLSALNRMGGAPRHGLHGVQEQRGRERRSRPAGGRVMFRGST